MFENSTVRMKHQAITSIGDNAGFRIDRGEDFLYPMERIRANKGETLPLCGVLAVVGERVSAAVGGPASVMPDSYPCVSHSGARHGDQLQEVLW
ncbi:hypothetical protein NKDENANG_00226 [Candidatus Entotheonellaceae bacterium PAL068K]